MTGLKRLVNRSRLPLRQTSRKPQLLAAAANLAETQRRKAEGNRQAFIAEVQAMNLIPSAPGEASQPGSDTSDQDAAVGPTD